MQRVFVGTGIVDCWPLTKFEDPWSCLTYFGTSTVCQRRSASRSEDRGISTPCLGIFGFWAYVMGMGMSAHGFTHV
jgi:hypothetical protein